MLKRTESSAMILITSIILVSQSINRLIEEIKTTLKLIVQLSEIQANVLTADSLVLLTGRRQTDYLLKIWKR